MRALECFEKNHAASPESAFFRAEGPHAPFAEGVEFAAGVTFEYGRGLLREVKTTSTNDFCNVTEARIVIEGTATEVSVEPEPNAD